MVTGRGETTELSEAMLGHGVYTGDGHRIGSLKEVQGNYIKINAPLQRDYWLSRDDVRAVESESLVLSYDDGDLSEHKLGAPGMAPDDDPMSAADTTRPVINEDDEREQRARMERELAEQTRNLDPSALHPQHEVPGMAPTNEPESERTRGETLSLTELLAYRERPLFDASGDEIGMIAEIYYDEASRDPEWIGADVGGGLGSKRVVAPVRGSYVLDGGISVPYTREQVLAGGVGEMLITVEREEELYAHFGLPYSRSESPTGLPDSGDDTADNVVTEGSFMTDAPEIDGVVPEAAEDQTDAVDEADAGTRVVLDRNESGASGDATAHGRKVVAEGQEALSDGIGALSMLQAEYDNARPTLPERLVRYGRGPLGGALAGLVATVPMTLAMAAMQRRLPANERGALPPREVTENIARVTHLDRLVKNERGVRRMTLAAHGAYGALAGSLYGALPGGTIKAGAAKGAAFGGGLWAASYLGWLPATGMSKSARDETWRRNALMLTANVLWGAATGAMAGRVQGKPRVRDDGTDDGRPRGA